MRLLRESLLTGADVTFEEFVTEQGAAPLRLAFVLTTDRHQAEDLTQTALADAYRHWRKVAAVDLDDAAIAETMGVGESSVRATAARALACLRIAAALDTAEEPARAVRPRTGCGSSSPLTQRPRRSRSA